MTSRRNTIQKDLVRNTVYEMRRHVTANEVYEFVKEFCPTIGKGTVYRNLEILVEEGNLRKVEVPDGPNRFDFILKNHYHVICIKDVYKRQGWRRDAKSHNRKIKGGCSDCPRESGGLSAGCRRRLLLRLCKSGFRVCSL